MKGSEIREKFLSYFESKGHTRVRSSSLVPEDDPTLLFSNAGMNQFKECFLGAEKRSYTRATTSQKCLRISGKHNDFENVGVTARHHTFFEMLGNFSFGDYFKKEAIEFAWEFVTEHLGFDKRRLWVTIFEADDDAEELWKNHTDVLPGRILRMGEKDNFWAMGETGPCGPCSEIHYYLGEDIEDQSEAGMRRDDGSYLEIWNLVFMQFNRLPDGTMEPLPRPSVDTGMGLERVAAIAQGVKSNYDCDLLRPIIAECERLSGFRYDGSSYELRNLREDLEYARDVAMRVIADHSRSTAFLIADGVMPGSDGRGYVLRRLIRRAIRHGRVLQFSEPFLATTTAKVIELMGDQYPELVEHRERIERIVSAEEAKFHETIDAGLTVLQREVEKLQTGERFPGDVAFLLHDTYGFPLDLTQDALKAYGMQVDEAAFEAAMQRQKRRSREDRKSQQIVYSAKSVTGEPTKFLGYQTTEAEGKLTFFRAESEDATRAGAGEQVTLAFDVTPFYAESGGQVGDTGTIRFPNAELEVIDTQKTPSGHSLHIAKIASGELTASDIGTAAALRVDSERRRHIRSNHSATHLVHAALRRILGDHVKQAGSRVDENSLRFDYSHFEPVPRSALNEIQSYVNEQIRANFEVETEEVSLEEAKRRGAIALFGEKYGDRVRMVRIGPESLELCGGTHASRSGDIGTLVVANEGGISAGVRRIECITGPRAQDEINRDLAELDAIAALLKSDRRELPEKIERILNRTKQLEKELERAHSKAASAASGDFVDRARTSPSGIKVIAEPVEGADTNTLRTMVDRLRVKLGSGVVALGSAHGEQAIIVTGVTSDLTGHVDAGSLVKEAVKESGGRGGGRKDFAQAGGVDSSKLDATLQRVFELVS